jgi:hypothetical protein
MGPLPESGSASNLAGSTSSCQGQRRGVGGWREWTDGATLLAAGVTLSRFGVALLAAGVTLSRFGVALLAAG